MGGEELSQRRQSILRVDRGEYNRPIAGDALCPEHRLRAMVLAQLVLRRPQRRVSEEEVTGEILEDRGVGGCDAKLAQLDLRRRPRQIERALRGMRVIVAVSEREHLLARRRDERRERDGSGLPRLERHAHA